MARRLHYVQCWEIEMKSIWKRHRNGKARHLFFHDISYVVVTNPQSCAIMLVPSHGIISTGFKQTWRKVGMMLLPNSLF